MKHLLWLSGLINSSDSCLESLNMKLYNNMLPPFVVLYMLIIMVLIIIYYLTQFIVPLCIVSCFFFYDHQSYLCIDYLDLNYILLFTPFTIE